ncbi:MAG: hypothetical protein ABIA59_09490 [Candidatus Latescibacterota bacterium]
MMKTKARISAALLLILVWITPGLIQAAGPGLYPAGEVRTVAVDMNVQQGKSRSPQKPEQPPEKKQTDPSEKAEQPIQEKEKKPPGETDTPSKARKLRRPPTDRPLIVNSEPAKRPNTPAAEMRRDGSSPLDVFADIESGWKHENVDALLQHFGKGKASISIGGIGLAGGRFSKSQSFYLLKDLFKYTLTQKFEFVQFRNMDSGNRRVYAVAERYYKRTDDGRLFKDKIYVALSLEEDRWVISEIKSIQ